MSTWKGTGAGSAARRLGRPAVLGGVLALLGTGVARAELYQAADLSGVTDEEDLRDLQAVGDLEEEDVTLLLEMLLDPIDLNRAGRDQLYQLPTLSYELVDAILAWRAEHGRLDSLDQLLEVPGFAPDALAQIRPFVIIKPPLRDRVKTRGSVKVRSAYTTGEDPRPGYEDQVTTTTRDVLHAQDIADVPETYMRARVNVNKQLDVGLVVLEKAGIGRWSFNPDQRVIEAEWGNPVWSVPKAYVAIDRDQWEAVLGSYSIGFGQRLVFDDSQRNRPNGFRPDDRITGSLDFSPSQRELGVAGTWRGSRLGPVTLGGTAFASFRPYPLYETRLGIVPPDGVETGAGSYGTSTAVYLPDGTLLPFSTLPAAYSEAILGAHADLRFATRHRLGLTGYGARVFKDEAFFFKNELPDRPTFGALGVDFTTGFGEIDIAGEAAVMDSGGAGLYVRGARGWKQGELVVSARRYGVDFDNPHSRGQAQGDVYSSSQEDTRDVGEPPFDPEAFTSYDRDRDEQGARLEGYYKFTPWLRLTGYSDQWMSIDTGTSDLDTQLRSDLRKRNVIAWDLGLRYQDRILGQGGRGRSFSTEVDCDPDDPEDEQCTGEASDDSGAAGAKVTAATWVTVWAIPETTVSLNYRRSYTDNRRVYVQADCTEFYYFQIGHNASVKSTTDLPLGLRTTARLRYVDDDVYGLAGERLLSAYAQLEWWDPQGRFRVSGRYTVDTDLRDPQDRDIIACENGGEVPEDRADWPADERERTPLQTVLATFEYRF